ncbi:hypothetical protein [Embleya sp. NPDC059259]|uniref:hypothetical protein n=1 Tax=unclassified Embleya TaxID=2699296 RepID=UPI0036B7E838
MTGTTWPAGAGNLQLLIGVLAVLRVKTAGAPAPRPTGASRHRGRPGCGLRATRSARGKGGGR